MRDKQPNDVERPATPYLDSLGLTRPRGVGRPRREVCRQCEGHMIAVGRLSKRGLCRGCATRNMSVACRVQAANAELRKLQRAFERASAP